MHQVVCVDFYLLKLAYMFNVNKHNIITRGVSNIKYLPVPDFKSFSCIGEAEDAIIAISLKTDAPQPQKKVIWVIGRVGTLSSQWDRGKQDGSIGRWRQFRIWRSRHVSLWGCSTSES